MSQPFVVSMKLVGDSSDAVAATDQAAQALDRLGATASSTTAPALRMEATAAAEADRALELLQATARGTSATAEAHAIALGTEARALRAAELATEAFTQSSRAAAAQRTNLIFQLNDIGVSLASGMNPLMVAAQQGSQIAGIYGGQGGLGKALSETASIAGGLAAKLWPIGAAAAAIGVSFGALTTEINRNAKVQVSFVDTLQATMELALGAVAGFFEPVTNWFGNIWDTISPGIANAAVSIIRSFDLAFRDTKTIWSLLPSALGDIAIRTANSVLDAIKGMLNGAIGLINDMTGGAREALKGLGIEVGQIGKVDFGSVPNPFAGSEQTYQKALGQNRLDVYSTDYLGLIGTKAQQIALGRDDDKKTGAAKDELKALALDGMGGLSEATKKAQEELDFYRSSFSGFITEAWQGIKKGENAFVAFGEAGANALDRISERFLSQASNSLFDMLFGSLFGGGNGYVKATGYVPSFGDYSGSWSTGGWTGGRRDEVAGLVHGEEFVVKAGPAAANRTMLEAMNAGFQVQPSAPEIFSARPAAMAAASSIASAVAQSSAAPPTLPPMHFTSTVTVEGAGADAAGLEQRFDAAMDERDRALRSQFQDMIEAHLENPMRRW